MPRRSGFGARPSSPSRSRSPPRQTQQRASPPPQRAAPPPAQRAAPPAASPPAVAPPAAVAPAAPAAGGMGGGGGMMAGIAQTAAGVALGHVASHAIIGAMSGGDKEEAAPAQQDYPQQPQQQYQAQPQYQPQYGAPQAAPQMGGPCAQQMSDFMTCAQNEYDISLCSGFNQALKDCKFSNPGQ